MGKQIEKNIWAAFCRLESDDERLQSPQTLQGTSVIKT